MGRKRQQDWIYRLRHLSFFYIAAGATSFAEHDALP